MNVISVDDGFRLMEEQTNAADKLSFVHILHVTPTGMIFHTTSLHCLTSDGSSASWKDYTGSDSQVWQARKDGSISSLADLTKCFSSSGGTATWQW